MYDNEHFKQKEKTHIAVKVIVGIFVAVLLLIALITLLIGIFAGDLRAFLFGGLCAAGGISLILTVLR